ncbi:MAG: MFS transporter [Gammaproteobacteria bacterium]|nr:MFS transporter [Gammaproteobacteria bacterium]
MNFLNRIAKTTAKIEAHELRAVLLSFAFVFTILASYYILRSIRDGLASDWTDVELSTIWTFTFFISFLVVALYGFACSKIKFKYLVPGVYAFFALTFFSLYILINTLPEFKLTNQIFYVWVSVFSLLNISVFWSFMADIYSKQQATRLFGFIAAGSSLGAIFGPTISLLLATKIGSYNLILVSASLLIVPVFIATVLEKIRASDLGTQEKNQGYDQPLGANILSGFKEFALNRLLLGIGIFIVLYTGISTFIYFELKNILVDYNQDLRTQIWAGMDLAVNVLAVVTAMFATSRLATRFGLSVTLPLVPIIIILGLLIVAVSPILWVVVGLQIVRRAGEYSITKPAREMLFTIVDRESRFKAKSVIDVVVYRAGDIFWAWAFTGLTQVLGMSLAAIALVGAGIASMWSLLAVYLGRYFDKHQVVESETKSNSVTSSS